MDIIFNTTISSIYDVAHASFIYRVPSSNGFCRPLKLSLKMLWPIAVLNEGGGRSQTGHFEK